MSRPSMPPALKEQFEEFKTVLAQHYPEQFEKLAAARPSDDEVERTFLDQAYSYIESKAGVLMQDPYRLGFEIVWSNENRTKILGIAAFRVGEDLYFAPVMFLNSRVRVPGLLWNAKSKQMSHLDPEWSRWLVSKSKFSDAGPADLSSGQHVSLLNNIVGFRRGGAMRKWSSAGSDTVEDMEGAAFEEGDLQAFDSQVNPENMAEYLKSLSWGDDGVDFSALNDFEGEQKKARAQLIKVAKGLGHKVANQMLKDINFASAMYSTYGEPDQWLPDILPAAPKGADLRFVPLEKMRHLKQASTLSVEDKAFFLKQGAFVEDNREDDQISTILSSGPETLESIHQAGVWKVLQPDGDFKELIALQVDRGEVQSFYEACRYNTGEPYCGSSMDSEAPTWLLLDGKKSFKLYSCQVAGELKKFIDKDSLSDVCVKGAALQTGQVYGRVNEQGNVVCFFSVIDKEDMGDDIVTYQIRSHRSPEYSINFYGKPTVFAYHPEKSGADCKTAGPEDLFVKLPARSLEAPRYEKDRKSSYPMEDYTWRGNEEDLADTSTDAIDRWVFDKDVVKKVACSYEKGTFTLSCGKSELKGVSRRKASFHLLKSAHVRQWTAAAILDQAESTGRCEVTLVAPDRLLKSLSKTAAAIGPAWQEPTWATGYDDALGVEESYDQSWAYPIEQNFPVFPSPRYNEPLRLNGGAQGNPDRAPEPTGSGIEWSSVSPEELAQLSQSESMPSVFHHGVLSALAQEQSAGIDLDITKELPSHYKFIDSLGRLIFRFHWNPAAFEKLYGSDDLSEIETQLTGAWSIVGKLVLNLQRRADSYSRKGAEPEERSGM